MRFPITATFTAIFALALVALSIPVTMRRVKVGDPVGDSTDAVLRRRIRAQGNCIEYVSLGVIGLGLIEAQGAPVWLVLSISGVLAGGRLLHAVGMWRGSAPLRGLGIILTHLVLISGAVRLLRDL